MLTAEQIAESIRTLLWELRDTLDAAALESATAKTLFKIETVLKNAASDVSYALDATEG